MTAMTIFTPDDIKKAVKVLREIRPAYVEMLEFYEQLFMTQESSKNQIDIEPIRISDQELAIKIKEKFPLINSAEFAIDIEASKKLFVFICEAAMKTKAAMSATAGKILASIDAALDLETLFTGILRGDDGPFEKAAKALSVEKNVLAFFAYSSIKPSVMSCAEQLSVYLKHQDPWQQGYCPICGTSPALSVLEGEGERSLICSFCWHKWPVKRVFCPYCNTTDSNILHYFFSENEKEYRVYTCENCKKYIKTVDTKNTERLIYPPLEHVVTMHLDMKANEMGFNSEYPVPQ
ncbi:MAG: formate dehydrogenase accessory protein FdhE [Desulfobacterales bacterium]|jgi:FdhE protein